MLTIPGTRQDPDRRITILYLIDTCVSPPGSALKGGAENQLYLLASSLDPNRFRPIVVQLSTINSSSLPIANGSLGEVNVFHLSTGRLYSLRGWRQLGRIFRLVRLEDVNIIHTIFEKSELIGSLIKRLSSNTIWITSRRDLGFKRNRIYDYLFRFAIRDCSRCLAVCHAVKDQMIQREGIPPERIDVIFNGLDLTQYLASANNNYSKRDLGVDDNVSLVGMVANFYHEIKGHRYFLKAAQRILKKVANVEFLLVGDGPLREKYEYMARDLGIEKEVHFLGRRSDVPAILKNLDVSVLTSTSEGLSNVILESMAAAKPVVATKVGGNTEIVLEGITGHLVPPQNDQAMAEAIISLLQNPDKAIDMGVAGRNRLEDKFNVQAMVRSYVALYESLIPTAC